MPLKQILNNRVWPVANLMIYNVQMSAYMVNKISFSITITIILQFFNGVKLKSFNFIFTI